MAQGFGYTPDLYKFGIPGLGGSPLSGGQAPSGGVWNEQPSPQPGMGFPGMGGGGFDAGQIGGPATGLGLNLGTANLALTGLQSLGSIWASLKSLKLAKKQFAFQKDFANANFVNSLKSYNTSLSDRSRSRGYSEGQSQAQIDQYTNDNKLVDSRKTGG